MNKTDYLQLASQYASFLAAVGGVSITVLTVILSLGSKPSDKRARLSRIFLITALIVSTISCFIGAHMLGETAASVSYFKNVADACKEVNTFGCIKERVPEFTMPTDCADDQPDECHNKMWAKFREETSGQRLFLLSSINIFISALLVLFAIMLLPTASSERNAAIKPISVWGSLFVSVGVFIWLILAGINRLNPADTDHAVWPAVIWGVICVAALLTASRAYPSTFWDYLLPTTFFPVILITCASFVYFGASFQYSGRASDNEILCFGIAVLTSYALLIVAGIKLMYPMKNPAKSRRCGKPPSKKDGLSSGPGHSQL